MASLKFKFQTDYPRVTFQRYGETCSFHLRIRGYEDGTFVFLYTNAEGDDRTNIVESAEIIFQKAVHLLEKAGHIPDPSAREKKAEARNFLEAERIRKLASQSRWIEYQSASVVQFGGDSYALVRYMPGPCWSYISKETLLSLTGIDKAFLDMDQPLECAPTAPSDMHAHVFAFLKNNVEILRQGRALGINISLTFEAVAGLKRQYGYEGDEYLANVRVSD